MITISTYSFTVILFLCANVFFFTGWLFKRRFRESQGESLWRNLAVQSNTEIRDLKERLADLEEENKHLKLSLSIYAERLSVGG